MIRPRSSSARIASFTLLAALALGASQCTRTTSHSWSYSKTVLVPAAAAPEASQAEAPEEQPVLSSIAAWVPPNGPKEPREASVVLDQLLRTWQTSDSEPATLAAFRDRFVLAERLKDLLEVVFDEAAPPLSQQQAEQALRFLETAFVFHRRPVPAATSPEAPPLVYADIDSAMRTLLPAYARIPRGGPLQPLAQLARTDAGRAERYLGRLAAQNRLGAGEAQVQQRAWTDRVLRLDVEDSEAWLARASARGDEEAAYEQQTDLAATYRSFGDTAAAARWEELSRPHRERCINTASVPDPVRAELETIRSLPDARLRKHRLQELRARRDMTPFLTLAVDYELFAFLVEQHALHDAELLGKRIRPQVRALIGIDSEAHLLGRLLEIERTRGDIGGFETTAAEYEQVRRSCAGAGWRGQKGYLLAEVAFSLGNYQAAEEHITDWIERWYSAKLRRQHLEIFLDVPVDLNGLLLLARVHRALGRIGDAERILAEVVAARDLADAVAALLKLYDKDRHEAEFRLASLYATLGHHKQALDLALKLRSSLDQLRDLDLWIQVALLEAEATLQTGGDPAELVKTFEALAPHLAEYPELNLQDGVNLYLFLAKYHRQGQRPELARARAARALELAQGDAVANLDQQILAATLLGELAADAQDLGGAVQSYRQAVALLRRTSLEIRGDVNKIGYRAERARAIPLLIAALLELHRRTPSTSLADEILAAIEEGKAQALTEMLFSSRGGVPRPDVLRRQLPANTAALEYYVSPDGAERPLRLLIDAAGVHIEALTATTAEIMQSVRVLREAVSNERWTDADSGRGGARALARWLLPAAWSSFDRIPYQRIFVVPAGELHLLPFSLLVDERGRYLDDADVELAYLPNLSALALGAPVPPVEARAAAFLNPALDADLHEWLSSNATGVARFTAAFRRWGGGTVAQEEPLRPDDFGQKAPGLDHAFLYAHASFRPDDPLASHVRLAGGPRVRGELTARDLVRTRLGPGLWVLAACSTGVVGVRAGDEILGLPRALLQAGARSVVISLWDVGSGTALELMSSFYEHLARGRSVSGALHAAAGALRAAGRPPFDWAAFIVVGQHDFRRR